MDAGKLEAAEMVSASKKLGRQQAESLLRGARELVVAKGKKVSRFAVGSKIPDGAVEAMLGPTGNLRAPTLKVGKTLLVGFNEDVYAEVFG